MLTDSPAVTPRLCSQDPDVLELLYEIEQHAWFRSEEVEKNLW